MKKFIYIALSASLILSGCYKLEIDELKLEITNLRNTEIASLSAQVTNMTSSIDEIKRLSAELKISFEEAKKSCEELETKINDVDKEIDAVKQSLSGQISDSQTGILQYLQQVKGALEGKLSNMKVVLETLQEKDTEIETKIANLQSYADKTFASKTWLEGTFATIDAQNAIISDITTIKAQIKVLENATDTVRSELKTLIDNRLKEVTNELNDNLASKVNEISDYCLNTIDAASRELYAAFEGNLAKSIDECEKSIMSWVNENLKDYYTIAEAEAKIAAFNALTGNVPEGKSLQREIEVIQLELGTLKQRVSSLYTEAISTAIEESEGRISTMIAEKIATFRSEKIKPIDTKVSELETEVENLWKELDALEGNIKTVEEQIAAVNKSLAVLDNMEVTLKEYIEGIQKKLQDADLANYNALKAAIDELTDLATGEGANSLQSQITALKTYIGSLPQGETSIADWINNSKKAIDDSFKLYYTIEAINSIKSGIDTAIGNHTGQLADITSRLSTIIADSQSKIESWISEDLKPYYTSAQQIAKLEELELKIKELFEAGDKTLQDQIDSLRTELGSAQTDLINACKTLIAQSISEMNAVITQELTAKLEIVAGNITALSAKVVTIEEKLATLKANKKKLDDAVKSFRANLDILLAFIEDSGYDNLKAIVDDLKSKIAALPTTYGSLDKFTEIYNIVLGTDGKGGAGTIKYEVDKMEQLTKDLSTAEATLAAINKYVSEGYEVDNLKEIVDDINARLLALRTTVIDGELRERLDSVLVLLYGEGTSVDNATGDSLFGKLTIISNSFLNLSEKFRSIAYIPAYNDGIAYTTYNSTDKIFTAKLDFVIRPASLAAILVSSGACNMRYISTPTKSVNFNDFTVKPTFIVSDAQEGILTATITITEEEKSSISEGTSVAFVVNSQDYDFMSDFIPLYVDGDYYITPNSYSIGGDGGQFHISAYPNSKYESLTFYYWIVVSSSSWITNSDVTNGGDITITVAPNNTSGPREGKLVLRYVQSLLDEPVPVSKEIVLKVAQSSRPDQNFVSVGPASLAFSFDGHLLNSSGEATSQEYGEVTVVTDDGYNDWFVSTEGYSWITAGHTDNKAAITVAQNNANTERSGKVIFTTFSGDSREVSISQKARPNQTLSFTPSIETGVSFNNNQTGYYWDIPVIGGWQGDYKTINVTSSDGKSDWTYEGASNSYFNIRQEGSVLTVAPAEENSSTTAKTTILTFKTGDGLKSYSYTLTQNGRPAQTLSFSPTSITDIPYAGGTSYTKTVTVTSSDGKTDWTVAAASGSEWIHVSKNSNKANVYADALPNNLLSVGRTGKVVFTSATGSQYEYSVTQTKMAALELSFNPSMQTGVSFNYDETGYYKSSGLGQGWKDDYKSITVTAVGAGTWTYQASNDYFNIRQDGNVITVAPKDKNSGSTAKTTVLTFTTSDGVNSYQYKLTQNPRAPQTLSLSTTNISLNTNKSVNSGSFTVTSSDGGTDWSYSKDVDWFTVTKTGNKVTVMAGKNRSGSIRTGTVTVTSAGPSPTQYKVTVTQAK